MIPEYHEMPNGSAVWYYPKGHHYCTEGPDAHNSGNCYSRCPTRIPGGSTISKNDGDTSTDGLVDWGSKLSCEGVARELSIAFSLDDPETIHDCLAWARTGESIWATLKRERLTWRDIRDEKGTVGTLSHGVLEDLARGDEPTVLNGYDRAAYAWWEARQPEVLQSEYVVYSAAHGFAGRADLRLIPTIDLDHPGALPGIAGKVSGVDAKTSGFISNAFQIQLALYDLAAVECGIGGTDVRFVLQLHEDGTWDEWESHADHDDALQALAVYNVGKRLGKAGRADWGRRKREREAIAKRAEQAQGVA